MDIELIKTIDCNQGAVRAARFNVDGSYCLTCGTDKKVRLWNPYTGMLLKTYGGHADEVTDVCASSDSSHLISCGADKSVIFWDVSTGQVLKRFRGHFGKINCVKFNEDSTVAVSGGHDNNVMCWDAKSRKNEPIQVLKEAKDAITSVQVTNHVILTSSLDNFVRQYDIRTGKVIRDFIGDPVLSAIFTQDSQCILASSTDIVRLMDKETGELLTEYKGHSTDTYVIESCVDAKDQYVFSGSQFGNVYCWELISAKSAKIFSHAKAKVVHCVNSHPKENYLLTASGDRFYLWGPQKEESESD